jgi:hypothetical protein
MFIKEVSKKNFELELKRSSKKNSNILKNSLKMISISGKIAEIILKVSPSLFVQTILKLLNQIWLQIVEKFL